MATLRITGHIRPRRRRRVTTYIRTCGGGGGDGGGVAHGGPFSGGANPLFDEK